MTLENRIKEWFENVAVKMKSLRDNSTPLPQPSNWLLESIYNEHNNNSETTANSNILNLAWIKLWARPEKDNCAERLNVNSLEEPWAWTISNKYKTTQLSEIAMAFYDSSTFKFALTLKKKDWSKTTLEEYIANSWKEYDWEVLDSSWTTYTWTCNFNFSVNTSRYWNDWDSRVCNDDWGWAMVDWDLSFNSPWPYLRSYWSNSWGFWNMNSNDWTANKLYENWNTTSWTPNAYVYLNTN